MEAELKDVDLPDFIKVKFLKMSDGVQLRHLFYHPDNAAAHVVIYPGMNTLVLSWIKVINLLQELQYKIDYIESREKHTAILEKKSKISKERMLDDFVEAINQLGVEGTDYTLLGSSLGSTTTIHCLSNKQVSPKFVILVGPSMKFRMPFIFKILLPFTNTWSYNNIGKKIMQKVIIRKYTNEKADPHQKYKYLLALDLAEPIRLKKTLRAWQGNSILDDLDKIDGKKSKCYLIGATEDKLHDVEETKLIADGIENAEYIDLKTNSAAHDQPLINLIDSLYK